MEVGDIDWSSNPTNLPVIDCLKLNFQQDALEALRRLESIDEIETVHYGYGDFTLRRGDDHRWRSLELDEWPSSLTGETVLPLLDSLAAQLRRASWSGANEHRATFLEWASKHDIEGE